MRIRKIISIVVCMFILVGMFSACRGGSYMEDFIDVQWTCDDIELQFTYTSSNREMGIGTVVKDNGVIDIVCQFTLSKNIEIYDKEKYNEATGYIECTALLIGYYELKDDVATVTIVEDNLYDGDYVNKKIYLQMKSIT